MKPFSSPFVGAARVRESISRDRAMRELNDYPVALTPVSVRRTYAFSLLPGAGNARRKVVINAALFPKPQTAIGRHLATSH
jgi:hypothetical protein